MKKTLVLAMLILVVVSVSLQAASEGKRHIVFAGIGVATSHFGGLFFDIGVEKRFFGNFYGQFLFDYYFDPYDLPGSNPSSYAYGLNFYGVYKIPASRSITFFLKAGFHFTTLRREWTVSHLHVSTRKDYGIAGGGGVRFRLGDKAFLYAGATYKRTYDEDEFNFKWGKFYGGLVFLVK